MQYTVRFLVFVLQLNVKLIDVRMEKETLFGWNNVVHLLVREVLKDTCEDVPMYNCGEHESKEHVTIYVQQVQQLETGEFSQTHSVAITD